MKGILGGLLALLLTWVAYRAVDLKFLELVFFDPRFIVVGIFCGALIGVAGQRHIGMESPTPHLRRLAFVVALSLAAAGQSSAQEQSDAKLRAQQEELARIRREREELQRRMRGLQSKVHDISEEVTNLDRQHDATVRVVRSLDQQLTTLNGEVEHTTANLVRAQDEVQVKQAVLKKRLVEIYKRGPLFTFEVLLSAKSFGDLVARYKYLHILAERDRTVVRRVDQLRSNIIGQRRQLVSLQSGVEQNRVEKAREAERLAALEQQRQQSLVKSAAGSEAKPRRVSPSSRAAKRASTT